jgi:hypothetical protein
MAISGLTSKNFWLYITVKQWLCFLEDSPFPVQVRTDHKNLETVLLAKEHPSRHMSRWVQELASNYNLQIKYVAGKENVVADALSSVVADALSSVVADALSSVVADALSRVVLEPTRAKSKAKQTILSILPPDYAQSAEVEPELLEKSVNNADFRL